MSKHCKYVEPNCVICTQAENCPFQNKEGSRKCKRKFKCSPSFMVINEKDKKDKKDDIIKILIILILIVILMLLMTMCAVKYQDTDLNEIIETVGLEFEDGDVWDGTMPENGGSRGNSESIEFPGYSELYSSKDKPVVLVNPSVNTVYMVYEILDIRGTVIYTTKAIKPGYTTEVDLSEYLQRGEHELTFVTKTFDVIDKSACNGTTQQVKVIID